MNNYIGLTGLLSVLLATGLMQGVENGLPDTASKKVIMAVLLLYGLYTAYLSWRCSGYGKSGD